MLSTPCQTPSEADRLIGVNVRRVRQKQKVTLSALASAVGISVQKLNNCETGLIPIGGGLLFCLSHALDVDVRLFLPAMHAANHY